MIEALTDKVVACTDRITKQNVGNILYGLKGMSSEYVEVRKLLGVLACKVTESQDRLGNQEISNAFYGMKSMLSEHAEVRTMLNILTGKMMDCQERPDARQISNLLFGLHHMSSEHAEVRTLLSVVAHKMMDCKERFGAQEVGNTLYGLQGMSSNHTEVRTLLASLAIKIAACQDPLDGQFAGMALYGLQGMTSEHPEVRSLLVALAGKIAERQLRLDAMQHVSNALYGLQGMNMEHAEVQLLFAALKEKFMQCLDKRVSTHADLDIVEVMRAFVLFRPHMVAILGSESLFSEYFHTLNDELVLRRQRGDSFFSTSPFRSLYEKDVYNRVVALETELQITDLRHNVSLLNCFESDITFTVRNENRTKMMVNVEADGMFHDKKRRKTFCRLRDQALTSKGIHVARITSKDPMEIDDILRKTVDHVRCLLVLAESGEVPRERSEASRNAWQTQELHHIINKTYIKHGKWMKNVHANDY